MSAPKTLLGDAAAPYLSQLCIPGLADDVDTLTAALAYAQAGWHVLPVKAGSKDPGSVVGTGWPTRSSRDPKQIVAWFAGTDHGIALHIGRSGAVAFDVDNADELPLLLAAALTRYPAPRQTTRTGSHELGGHFLYATPPGRRLGNSKGQLAGPWGEVRGRNGVLIVAPSIHAKADEGGLYRWARTGPVPPLPPSSPTPSGTPSTPPEQPPTPR